MKLHLPKALFTAVMALFAVSQTAWAGTTYNLLESGDAWDMTGRSPLPSYSDGTITGCSGTWKQSAAVYSTESGYYYTVDDSNTLTFTFTINQTGGYDNSVVNLAFVGAEQVLALGTFEYGSSALGYGTSTDTGKDVYHNGTAWESSSVGQVTFTNFTNGEENVSRVNGIYTYTGTVTKDTDGNYLLDLSVSLTQGDSAAVETQYLDDLNLGTSFNINRVSYAVDGGSPVSLSGLTITGDLKLFRHDTTIAGAMNVADATWIFDGGEYTTSQINMTDGSATLGLTGSGESASITFEDGTNVASISVVGGSLTMQSSGSLATGELVVADDATAIIGSAMTAGSINLSNTGALEVAAEGNLTVGSDLSFLSGTTGTGTISIAENATITPGTSAFAGTLDVADGKELKYGNAQKRAVSIADATVRLGEGSTLRVEGFGSTLGVLDVQGDANIYMNDSDGQTSAALTIGEVKIAEGKTLGAKTNWEGMLVFEKLNADGDLSCQKGSYTDSVININSIEKSGNISIAGTNAVLTMGVDGDSVLNLGGDVTSDSGTIIIKGELAGTSTISGGTINVESTASVTGDITFGFDINVGGTIASTGDVTLGGNVYVVDAVSSLKASGDGLIYSSNEGKDGYIAGGSFYVVEGTDAATATLTGTSTLYDGDTELGTIVRSEDGKSLVVDLTTDTPSGIWYVNTQDFTVDGSDTNLAKDATGYIVAAGQTLTISANQSDTMTADQILVGTTGEGNITLGTNAMVGNQQATQATGTLTINIGATLKVGDGTGHSSSIASFSAVNLNGGTLRMHNNGSTVNNLTVSTESTLHVQDSNSATSTTRLAGTTTLNAELNVTSGYKGTLTVDKLTGTGNLDIDAGDNGYADTLLVNINKVADYSGVISYKASGGNGSTKANNVINIKNTTDDNKYGAINIGGLTLENSGLAIATANLDMGRNDTFGANSLGDVSISGGSVLTMFNRGNSSVVNMSSLTVTGAATVQTKRDNSCFQGEVNIASLANGGDDAATLNLASGSKTTAVMAYNLNGGEGFNGTINVKGDAASGGQRRVALNINAEDAAKGAVINFLDATTDAVNDAGANYTALGLGSNATVAGLGAESVEGADPVLTTNAVTITGYKIKANVVDQFATRDDADTDTSARTLTIDAAEGKEYSVKANVGANVNLTQSGAGTQNISGDQSAMNGTLEASAGALNVTNTGNAMSLAGVKATGGVVQVSDAANVVTVADMTVSGGGQVKGDSMTVTGAMTISNSNAIELTGALVMTGATVDLSGFTVDTTTAADTYVYTLGTAAGGITADETISFTGLNVDNYTAALVAMTTDPTANAVMLLDGAATNNYLVLTLTKDATDTPDVPSLTQLTVTGAQGYENGVLTLTTAENAADAVFGSTLDATMTDAVWDTIVGTYDLDDEIAISFVGADGQTFDFNGADDSLTAPTITINGDPGVGEGATVGADGTVVGNYVTAYIPEPTTTTLSLLALAAMAVRRRRK